MFKEILQNLLKEKGISQRQLSVQAKIPTTTISGWLNAGRLPDYMAIKKLSLYFEVTADYLLGLEDETGTKTHDYDFEYQHGNTKLIHKERK